MNQTAGERADQPATARAEELLDNLGRSIGNFATQAGQRIQNAATSIRDAADRMDQPSTEEGEKAHPATIVRTEEQGKLAMARAEDAGDQLGHRLSDYLARAGSQIQRITARIRKEGEDVWAEAQTLRQSGPRSREE